MHIMHAQNTWNYLIQNISMKIFFPFRYVRLRLVVIEESKKVSTIVTLLNNPPLSVYPLTIISITKTSTSSLKST